MSDYNEIQIKEIRLFNEGSLGLDSKYPKEFNRINWEYYDEIKEELYQWQIIHYDEFVPPILFDDWSDFSDKMYKLLSDPLHGHAFVKYRHSVALRDPYGSLYEFIENNPEWVELIIDDENIDEYFKKEHEILKKSGEPLLVDRLKKEQTKH